MDINSALAVKIKEIRESKNISVYRAMKDMNISWHAYHRIETGVTSLTVSRFISICDFYEVDPSELLKEVLNEN